MRIPPYLLFGPLLVGGLVFRPALSQAAVQVEALRFSDTPARDRLVLDLNGPTRYSLAQDGLTLTLTIRHGTFHADIPDLTHATVVARVDQKASPHGVLTLRIVTKQTVALTSFMLKPQDSRGNRLVLDLTPIDDGHTDEQVAVADAPAAPEVALPKKSWRGTVVIGVDAGHGGQDPGAVGRDGTYEKDVTLSIARDLEKASRHVKGIHVVLTRSDDEFLTLGERPRKARGLGAKLFVSIHADSADNPAAHGASVYVLSAKGASDRAALLAARKENLADLADEEGGSNRRHGLSAVAIAPIQQYSMAEGRLMATAVLHRLGDVTELHCPRYGEAAFAVLKSHDLPSILIETGYLSNPGDEARLDKPDYQRRLAKTILAGLLDYLAKGRAGDSVFAEAHAEKARLPVIYRVRSGDQLWRLANKFHRSVQALRAANPDLRHGLQTGMRLTIPSLPGQVRATQVKATVSKTPTRTWTYRVPAGTALSVLAQQYHTTPAVIRDLNAGLPHGLQSGMALQLPGKSPRAEADALPTEGYTVKRGDRLEHLAHRYHTTPQALREINDGMPDGLMAGIRIRVPAIHTYTTRRGDVLRRIAKRHGVTLGALREDNPDLRHGLKPGMVLLIPAHKA